MGTLAFGVIFWNMGGILVNQNKCRYQSSVGSSYILIGAAPHYLLPSSEFTCISFGEHKKVPLYEDWASFECLVVYSMDTMYVEVYAHTVSMSVLCMVPIKYHVGWVFFLPNGLFAPEFLAHQLPKLSCCIIRTVRDFYNNHYFVSIVNAKKRTSSTMPFGYGKLKRKRKKKGIPPRRKREVKIWANSKCRPWRGTNCCGTIIDFWCQPVPQIW